MNDIAKALLDSKAVHIQPNPQNFFTWTSGKRSPIYCDNRTLISFPKFRQQVNNSFIKVIRKHFSDVELIAGTATAGIPWAAWIADSLNLPMVYIRSHAKGHGLKTAIEGVSSEGQKTLIIEDLISTGKSSIEAYQHAKDAGLNVQAVLSIFTYDFPIANSRFKEIELKKLSLCTLESLLIHAKDSKLLDAKDVLVVENWKESFR